MLRTPMVKRATSMHVDVGVAVVIEALDVFMDRVIVVEGPCET